MKLQFFFRPKKSTSPPPHSHSRNERSIDTTAKLHANNCDNFCNCDIISRTADVVEPIFTEHRSIVKVSMNSLNQDTGDNILHIACKNNPSPEIVLDIMNALPDAVFQTNDKHQYPIHCAAEWGACPEVIHMMCERNPTALEHQDIEERTPLILACKCYMYNYKNKEDRPFLQKEHAAAQSVRLIVRNCPSASQIEDNNDSSCIEYALISGIDLGTIRCIQRASYREWKRREKTNLC